MTTRKGKSRSSRWEKDGEEEFEGIIRLGKDQPSKKRAESRWEADKDAAERPKKRGAESRWEGQQNNDAD